MLPFYFNFYLLRHTELERSIEDKLVGQKDELNANLEAVKHNLDETKEKFDDELGMWLDYNFTFI